MTDMNDSLKAQRSEFNSIIRSVKAKQKEYEEFICKLDELAGEVNQVEKDINKVKSFYNNRYLPFLEKFTDNRSGVKTTLRRAKNLAGIIVTKRDDLIKKQRELSSIYNTYQSNVDDLKILKNEIRRVHESSESDKNKIEESRNIANKKREEIEKMHSDLESLLGSEEKVDTTLGKITASVKNITKLEVAANDTNEKITNLYEIVSNKTLAGAFDNQRNDLSKELDIWLRKIFTTSLSVFFATFGLFILQIGFNGWTTAGLDYNFYIRFLIVGPVVFYLVFCTNQYNHIRKSLEKYTFKTNIALSIEAHTDLLNKAFKDTNKREEVYDFTVDSLRKIYDEPYLDEKIRFLQRKESVDKSSFEKIIDEITGLKIAVKKITEKA